MTHLPPVEEAAHRTDHARRPSSKHLHDPASLQGSQQLFHAHLPLRHLKLALTHSQEPEFHLNLRFQVGILRIFKIKVNKTFSS